MHRTSAVLVVVASLIPCTAAAQGPPLGPEFRVNSFTTGNQGLASVAADGSANLMVVWTGGGQDGSSYGIFGQRYAGGGSAQGPEFRVNTYTTSSQYRGVVAADFSGGFLVVWESSAQDGSGRGIFGQRYDGAGVPQGAEFPVNTYTTNDQYGPAVAASLFGGFVVLWHSNSQDGSGFGVFGQRYDASGVPLGPEFRVNSFTPGNQFYPSAGADSSGGLVVSWSSLGQDGSGYGIFGQRYASSGAPLGPEFRVNSYTTSQQVAPIVAADSSGDFVVVWNSNGQDGQGSGVFGQRYSPIVPVELIHFRVE